MAISKEFDFMGYLHFDVTLDGDMYDVDVYNKLDHRYADRANDDGALITYFTVPRHALGDLSGVDVVDVKNRMYLTNSLDDSLAPVRVPIRFNKKANKYEFHQGVARVAIRSAALPERARPDTLATKKIARGK